ncbi:MAG: hypothetical protein ACFFEF_14365 [Candidatus Thorarchaeota archaeon]
MKAISIAVVLLLLLSLMPFPANVAEDTASSPTPTFLPSEEVLLSGIPYVWQEINGFCAWAATSVAMQAAGADLDLYDVFAASTIGFSFAYIHYNDTILMYPGAIYTQAEPTDFISDQYGINYTIYLLESIDSAEQIKQVWESEGINVGLLGGQEDAFNLMRSTINHGLPLLISVDPSWLPAEDYNFLREQGATGGAHGVLIVGYDDNLGIARIIDPGVGSFGDSFGFPEDGRGNYSEITYTALINAWANRFYISSTFAPSTSPPSNAQDRLGIMVRDKLLGVGTTYSPSSSSAYLWSYGERGFRQLSEDITVEGLTQYFSVFDGIQNERLFKAAVLLFIGLGIETTITLQYLSYRNALVKLPDLLSDYDLDEFSEAAGDALPHLDALSNNMTLIYPGNLSYIEGLASSVFQSISQLYNSTGDLETALQAHSIELNEISAHFLAIADSWQAAGNALAIYWPNDIFTLYGVWIAIGVFGVAVLVIYVVIQIKRTPSQ